MLNFTSLNRKICAFNQFFNQSKDGANIKRKAVVVITMFFVIIGANLATAVTAIANVEASSMTISGKPSRPVSPVPPNREGSDDPSNTEGINQQGSLLT